MNRNSRWAGRNKEQWLRDVDAFLESRHAEPRSSGPASPFYPEGWRPPLPQPGEREVLSLYGSHWLYRVTSGTTAGYRLVGLVSRGTALVWDLPGYSQRDAETMCRNFVDGYLPGT